MCILSKPCAKLFRVFRIIWKRQYAFFPSILSKYPKSNRCTISVMRTKNCTHIHQWRIQDFPWGGGGGRRLPTQVLFGENVCENERIGSRCGGAPGSANVHDTKKKVNILHIAASSFKWEA